MSPIDLSAIAALRLAALVSAGTSERHPWQPAEFGSILHHQLRAAFHEALHKHGPEHDQGPTPAWPEGCGEPPPSISELFQAPAPPPGSCWRP